MDRAELPFRFELCQPFPRLRDRLSIAIEAGNIRTGVEQREGVTAAAERAVEDARAGLHAQHIEDFIDEDRGVVGGIEAAFGHV